MIKTVQVEIWTSSVEA